MTASAPPRPPAHPRSRGENVLRYAHDYHPPGSSPLTRGKRQRHRGRHQGNGLIPAHAGKTTGRGLRAQQGRAHPRSRGENTANGQTWGLGVGSSPLTRGKPAGRAAGQAVAGLIPAHAGKTSRSCSRAGCRGAHPRSRGENELSAKVAHNAQGSSPLTRGKRTRAA